MFRVKRGQKRDNVETLPVDLLSNTVAELTDVALEVVAETLSSTVASVEFQTAKQPQSREEEDGYCT